MEIMRAMKLIPTYDCARTHTQIKRGHKSALELIADIRTRFSIIYTIQFCSSPLFLFWVFHQASRPNTDGKP